MITREAQMVLHQKLNLVGNMNRQYDSQFARTGGKIGTSLNLRVPLKYTVRSGATYSAQNVVERQVACPVLPAKGIDCTISDVEMAMSLENSPPDDPGAGDGSIGCTQDRVRHAGRCVHQGSELRRHRVQPNRFHEVPAVREFLPKTSLRSIAVTASWVRTRPAASGSPMPSRVCSVSDNHRRSVS